MSVIVTVGAVGTVLVNTGVLTGIATAVASTMGLRAIKASANATEQEQARHQTLEDHLDTAAHDADVIEVTSATAGALAKLVAERCEMTFGDAHVTLTVKRDIRGTLTVRAHSETLPKAELSQRAEALLGGIQQQVAYREAVGLLKSRGFLIEQEERLEDGTARVRVVKIGG